MTHKIWWDMEGSAMRPLPNEDMEEFAKRISEIAWSNGQYKEREACAVLRFIASTPVQVLALQTSRT